jgi:hypothetical protein
VECSLWKVLQIQDIQTSIANRMWLTGNTPTTLTSKDMSSKDNVMPSTWWWWNTRRNQWILDIRSLFIPSKTPKEEKESIDDPDDSYFTHKMRRAGYLLREMASGYLQLLDACKEVDPAVLDIETQIIAEKAWGKIVDGQLAQLIQQTRQEVTSSVSIGDSSEEIVSNFLVNILLLPAYFSAACFSLWYWILCR